MFVGPEYFGGGVLRGGDDGIRGWKHGDPGRGGVLLPLLELLHRAVGHGAVLGVHALTTSRCSSGRFIVPTLLENEFAALAVCVAMGDEVLRTARGARIRV